MTSMDKRKHARFNSLNLSYLCLDEDDNIIKQGMGRTLNVSASGILLETYFPIDASHNVLLTLGLGEDIVDIKGKAVHSRSREGGKYEIGIQFVDLVGKNAETLQEYLTQITDEEDD